MQSVARRIALISLLFNVLIVISCSEDVDESNLYVSQEETINDYLATRPEFSSFHYLLERTGYDKILSAYGQYTCFAPTNEGVAEYVDSLWSDEVNLAQPHNGMTAPGLEGLTDSLCLDIVLFHLMSSKTIGIEMDKGNTLNTLISRDIISSVGPNGEIVLNGYSIVTQMDVELQNGIVHEIDHALRRSNALIGHELELHDEFSLFSQAVNLCGLGDTLVKQMRQGQILPKKESNEYIPQECRVGYTIFAETDEVFAKGGITSLEQLIDSANAWYGGASAWYDYLRQHGIDVSTGTDYRNPWNALNMFLRYHVTEVKVSYNKLYRSHGELPEFTPVEYYETMLPFTLLKVNRLGVQPVVNRWVENSTLTDQVALLASNAIQRIRRPGIFVSNKGYSCLNGFVHPLTNGILRYDDGTAHGVLNERIRIDDTALLTEMTSNNIRMATDAELRGMNGGITSNNGRFAGDGSCRIPENFSEHMIVYNGDETKLFYLSAQNIGFANYQGDELNCVGAYDFALRLPPVPAGMYELRLGYSAHNNRGMVQIYLGRTPSIADMIPIDIPLDMRRVPNRSNTSETRPDALTGWCDWTVCDDKGVASDVNMRYLSFMRGPLGSTVNSGGTVGSTRLRDSNQALRRIILRQQFEQGEYWLRFKTMLPSDKSRMFHLDYIEFCPENVYNNAQYSEDMY